MTARDVSSPGFVVTVIAMNPEARIKGPIDQATLGQILARASDQTHRILSFTYEEDENEHDVLKLRVDNHDLYYLDHPAWVKGNLVRFFFGYPGRIFRPKYHVVDSIRGFLELTITCVETAALGNEAQTRKWENKSLEDIVRQFIIERVFGPVVDSYSMDFSDTAVTEKKTRTQARQTPWQFLQRLAEPLGFEVYIDGKVLNVKARDLATKPLRKYQFWYGVGDLLSFDIKEWRVTDRPAETEVVGRSPLERKTVKGTGSNVETTRDSLGGQNGVSITPNQAGALQVRPGGKAIQTTPAGTDGEAKTEADSRFKKQEQKEIEATARIIGDPELPAKSLIEIDGISRQLSGIYYVKKHVHVLDRSTGYTGTLSLLRNAVTAQPTETPATLDKTKAAENTKKADEGKTRLVFRPDRAGKLIQQRE